MEELPKSENKTNYFCMYIALLPQLHGEENG
jgi:hypothetical protein